MLRLDENIKKDVVDQLFWDSRVNAADVQVDVTDGQVTLKGTVPSYNSRLSAESDAWTIEGVIGVNNRVIVRSPSKKDTLTDAELKERAEKTLFWDADIDHANIDVEINKGYATLAGSVDTYWKKWEAEKKVARTDGITEVDNQLTIVPSKSVLDKVIADNIVEALHRNLYINADDVVVKVEDGIVTLTGIVPSWFVRSQAEDVATYTDGIIEVINKLSTNGK